MTESPQPADPPPLSLTGEVFDGRYRIEKTLGAGGMGAVYQGRQVTLDKPVAIKVLKPEYADRELYVKRFLREARAASRISHRNIVEVIDFGQTKKGRVYFVMEFLQGEDLSDLIRRAGALPWSRVKHIVLQVVRALKAAHSRGVIHRDVKPANCFIVDTPEDERGDFVKVLDFGIAKVVDPLTGTAEGLTSSSQVMGTAMYMAPEQAMGREVDARTDVYALGVVAFEMLAGRKPFSGLTAFEVLMRRVNEPPPRVRDFVPEVALEVESLLFRAMAREPAGRFQSMRELETAILAIPDDARESVTVRPSDGTTAETLGDGTDPSDPAFATATSARHKETHGTPGGGRRTLPYTDEPAPAQSPASAGVTVPSIAPLSAGAESGPSDPVMRPVSQSRAWVGIVLVALLIVGGLSVGAWSFLAPPDDATVGEELEPTQPRQQVAKLEGEEAKTGEVPPEVPPSERPDAKVEEPPPEESVPELEVVAPPPEEKPAPTKKKTKPKVKPKPPAPSPVTPTPPPKKTDQSVIGRIKAKARTKCAPADAAGTVKLKFIVQGTTAGVVSDRGSDAGAAAVRCVTGLIKDAEFPAAGARSQTVSIKF